MGYFHFAPPCVETMELYRKLAVREDRQRRERLLARSLEELRFADEKTYRNIFPKDKRQ